jgi:natural product precursor
MKKITLKGISSTLNEKEMKNVLGGVGGDGKCGFLNGEGRVQCTFDAESADFMSVGGWWCCNCAAVAHCIEF